MRLTLEDFDRARLRRLIQTRGAKPNTSTEALIAQAAEQLARYHAQGEDPEVVLSWMETPEEETWLRALFTLADPDTMLTGEALLHAAAYAHLPHERLARVLERLVLKGALLLRTPIPLFNVLSANQRDFSSFITLSVGQWVPFTRLPPVLEWELPAIAPHAIKRASLPITHAFERLMDALYRERVVLNAETVRRYQEGLLNNLSPATPSHRSRAEREPLPLVSALAPESLQQLTSATELEPPLVEFLFALASVLGLIELPPSQPPYAVGLQRDQYAEWATLSPEEQLSALWNAWLYWSPDWVEARHAIGHMPFHARFSLVRRTRPELVPAIHIGSDLCAARRFLARMLRGVKPKAWVSAQALIEQSLALSPRAFWSILTPEAWDFVAARSLNGETSAEVRALAQSAVFTHMLAGPLLWFGGVEIATDAQGRIEGVRLTPLGHALVSTPRGFVQAKAPQERLTEEDAAAVLWLDDHTVRVATPARCRELVKLLHQIADPAQAPHTFTFTPQSIERGLRCGLSTAALEAACAAQGAPLPPALAEHIRRLEQRVGRVRVYESLAVVEVNDEALARELLTQPEISRHVMHVLGPTAFAVRDAELEALIQAMQRKGYTPRIA
ncbi:MAG: helicase-associated domain-containing protein [Thermoflexales bacterium]|nr:helicase-associated domain-containing protein [Thermoflexales bacterium]MCS7324307.1 helicase-associated domain-containing protein [Thermoflexales bacterium]MCX7939560.1 helicase-associated domain-containing protein [Thermoflexales bacterium]MDW8053329.1 helicase-associated domain-containing protein [Anaerolineae bacterium]MDW8291980.1 helicase-associated domain-containing protein [Anaerolineae bacterium]